MSHRKKNRSKTKPGNSLRIVPLNELRLIHEQLEAVSKPGTDPIKQASVLTWAMQYQGAYYRTRRGNLRRVFPKPTEVVLFSGVGRGLTTQALLTTPKGENDAANQPQAN